jgi:hypothetical protein
MDQHESPSTAKVLQVEMMPVWLGAIPVVVGDAVFVVLVEVSGPATQYVFPICKCSQFDPMSGFQL